MLTFENLLNEYNASQNHYIRGEILRFEGVGELDVYNPTFLEEENKLYVVGRVESRESNWTDPNNYDSQIIFFEKKDTTWKPVENAPTLDLAEDPFCTWVNDGKKKRLLFGFVQIDRSENPPSINTKLFLTDSLFDLKESSCIAEIRRMKDIRLMELPDRKILICGRPIIEDKRRVSLQIVDSLSKVNQEVVDCARVLSTPLDKNTHLGNNQLFFVRRGKIGVLGHVATEDKKGNYIYTAALWTVNLDSCTMSIPKLIATRDNFPTGMAKSPRHKNIVFPGSLLSTPDGKQRLIAGLNDVNCGTLTFPGNIYDFLDSQ